MPPRNATWRFNAKFHLAFQPGALPPTWILARHSTWLFNVTPRVVTFNDYLDLPRPNVPWLVHKLVPRTGAVLLIGLPKQGKSFYGLELARRIAGGEDVLGRASVASRVLYLQIDAGEDGWAERGRELRKAGVEFPGNLVVVHPEDEKRPINIEDGESYAYLKGLIDASDPALVVIDTLREIHNADEDKSTEMKRAFDPLTTLLRNRCAIFIHHTTKIRDHETPDPDPVLVARGSGYVAGKVDTVWLLHRKRLRIASRFAPDELHTMVWKNGTYWPTTTELELALKLCSENATLDHSSVADIAESRFGWSRSRFFTLVAGQKCSHH